jgi:L-asparaginase II
MSEPMVQVWRGEIVESLHHGDIAIVDTKGNLLWSFGDPYRVTYARSSAKPWQAIPLVESGAADYFGMTDEELALSCASHNGEMSHVDKVRAFLSRIGVPETALQCGAHPPYHAASYESALKAGQDITAVHNNCSGKHSAMLALAKYLGTDLDTYLNRDHPIQTRILDAVSDITEVPKDQIHIGVDGCGVPVFGMPIANMAQGFAKLARPDGEPEPRRRTLTRLRDAMMAHPHFVAGTGRFCTALMEAADGAIVGKAGAEGVYCAGLVEHGIGICVKVDDGNGRGSYPAVVEALAQTGLMPQTLIDSLSAFHQPQVKNHQGTLVGRLEPCFQLQRHTGN